MRSTVPYVLPFSAISLADLPLVGGKGANLGEMTQAGLPVPPGFCVTTAAFQEFIATCPQTEALYSELEALDTGDLVTVRRVGEKVRRIWSEAGHVSPAIQQAIRTAWEDTGRQHSYAVRSSATAEDLPDASFAGQQDTYLNVRGEQALLDSVRRCWVSLFTDRAILYRSQNQFSHREVFLSVVVQRMVLPEVSGILFTADPVSGHRHIASIDAGYGLGEALVSGLITPDLYKVDKRQGQIVARQIGEKKLAIRPLANGSRWSSGGTFQEEVPLAQRQQLALNDEQIMALAQLGNQIEAHYGKPQDIEWCIEQGQIYIVQSRPITSLYPLPQPQPEDGSFRVYVSFSHAQVMTDPMPPMAHSIWRILFPFGKASRPLEESPYMCSAGGRLYIDLTPLLHIRLARRILPRIFTAVDSLSAQALAQLVQRDAFVQRWPLGQRRPRVVSHPSDLARWMLPLLGRAMAQLWWRNPQDATDKLGKQIDCYITQAQAHLAAAQPGVERLRWAQQLLGTLFIEEALAMPPYLMAGVIAQRLLLRLARQQGLQREVEATMRGLAGNVTTEMDLAVGDIADAARQSPELVAHLQAGGDLSGPTAVALPNTAPFRAAWNQFMATYGMRGPSEIDISRPRWRDDPSSLLRMVAGSLGHAEPGAHRQHHRQLMAEGEAAGERLATAVRQGLLGPIKTRLIRRLVRVSRQLLPIREHPKFLLIRFLGLMRTAVLEAGHILHQQNRINAPADVWYLELPELINALDNPLVPLRRLIAPRQSEMARFHKLTPPRVITSDGEIPVVQHHNSHTPAGALSGSPVSAGVVEGVAHVVLPHAAWDDPTQKTLLPGEILIAPFIDPGWTPLFINAAGLVMEVGGLMTHGSVVAREYGIPAVVSVLEATKRIQTGQRVRVNGDLGYVEILTPRIEL